MTQRFVRMFLLTSAVLSLLSMPLFAQDTIHLTTGQWPPFLSQKAATGGIAAEIVTNAFAKEGITVQFEWLPWKRAFTTAQRGAADGTAVWSYSDGREKDFFYSEPVISVCDVFFHLKTFNFNWKTMEDLKGIPIGATTGYYYGDEFAAAENSGIIKVQRASTDIQNLKKLLKGRIKLFAAGQDVGYELLRQYFTKEEREQVTHHPKPLKTASGTLHLLFAKKNPGSKALMVHFNRGLRAMLESGELKEILKKKSQP